MSRTHKARRVHKLFSSVSVVSAIALAAVSALASPCAATTTTTIASTTATAVSAAAFAVQSNSKTPDKLTLNDGTVVMGAIVSETDTEISINQVFRVGAIEQIVLRTYQKSEIKTVERDAQKAESGSNNNQPQARPGSSRDSTTTPSTASEGAPTVYFVTLTGEFGLDMSYTPIKDIIEDAKRHQPDYFVIKIDADFSFHGEDKEEFDFDIQGFFSRFEIVQRVQGLFLDGIPSDPTWVKKPKVITWVNNAMGGATLLPFVTDTMYFTPEGRLGGAGPADVLLGAGADQVVREKWIDMSITPMEGVLLRNGYPYQLANAFARMDYVLSYRIVGGRPEFFEGFPEDAPAEGYILLVDDGDLNAGRRDTVQDRVRLRINDWLVMDAQLAQRLGVSKGVANTLAELMFQEGVVGEFRQIEEARGDRIIQGWRDEVTRAEGNLRKLVREFAQVQVQGNYNERQRARGQQINILRQIQAIFRRYGESINPAQYGTAINWDIDIEIQISRIRTDMRLDQRD